MNKKKFLYVNTHLKGSKEYLQPIYASIFSLASSYQAITKKCIKSINSCAVERRRREGGREKREPVFVLEILNSE
jgi:hypothetical protein